MIETRELTKRYGRATAVDRLHLRIRPGEVYGFLGLNGAGKSTTIRMLLGMTRPTAGTVRLFDRDDPDWSRVGYLVDGAHAYPGLTVRENLEIVRRLRRMPDRTAVDRAVALFGLDAHGDRRAGTLSLGNAQRLGLAKAVLHRPDLLVLDEPANGLDPAGIVELRGILRRLAREEGTAILVSSHILAEVARTADRIGVIDRGRKLTEFPATELPRCTCGAEDLEDVFLRLLNEHRQAEPA
ncbi:ABC transporter ATP-binding protein [Actinomadura algeriensis]|uniref:ABC-2 type transport system ATP-binding protein n=1 Tax=Actinomadura algeriensis TaxID=1679523 RepID=A0ABR9JRG1_9ACTN|nr:ABC transporter ATP-binding protein [Actinomadura algeriensis]MBE1533117.1 ABC-2 type transport system ATP-binding protein [Actinomadura algeriensis]